MRRSSTPWCRQRASWPAGHDRRDRRLETMPLVVVATATATRLLSCKRHAAPPREASGDARFLTKTPAAWRRPREMRAEQKNKPPDKLSVQLETAAGVAMVAPVAPATVWLQARFWRKSRERDAGGTDEDHGSNHGGICSGGLPPCFSTLLRR